MASMALRQTALGWGAGLAGLRSTGPALAHTVLSRGPGDLDLPLPPATSAARSGVGADGAGPALLDPTRLAGLAGAGIPPVVLGAYQGAVAQLAVTNPGCLLRWTVLAGIGKVESNHGRDGAGITAAGTILPAILGPVLDGTVAAVVGLHLADTREHRPAEQTSRVGHGQLRHGALVGAQDDGRYAGARAAGQSSRDSTGWSGAVHP